MRIGLADSAFELPPRFALVERRMAGQAIDAWVDAGGGRVEGFAAHEIMISDPGGEQRIDGVGARLAQQFGLASGMRLQRRDGLAAELCAACDLLALQPIPVPFEASLMMPSRACVLVRGVALPIGGGENVQIIMNWREVLNRAATVRLRRELSMALGISRHNLPKQDPFS